jgi:hypothetical protein
MWNSMTRSVLLVSAACLIAAASCDDKSGMSGDDGTGSGGGMTPGGTVATGGTCGTIAGLVCASAADYCQMPVGTCQIPDMAGTCTMKSQVILAIFDPVCGCDGVTYSNSSAASNAGISVLSQGACPPA